MENGEFSQSLIRKALRAREAREAARKAREEARSGKKKGKTERLLSGKLTPANLRMLPKWIVPRLRVTQPVVRHKGDRGVSSKLFCHCVVRSWTRKRPSWLDIMKNEEISNSSSIRLRAGVGPEFNVDDANYDKVIIMTDADIYSAHTFKHFCWRSSDKHAPIDWRW